MTHHGQEKPSPIRGPHHVMKTTTSSVGRKKINLSFNKATKSSGYTIDDKQIYEKTAT